MLTEMKGRTQKCTATQRRILFVSHATPQDNEFTKWLVSQLAIAGYEVWCDITELFGGEQFWNNIENAISDRAFRFLFVSTIHANKKMGTLRELRLAQEAQSRYGLKDFIIPLKIDLFPFTGMEKSIQGLNMVRFDKTWADGLRNLLTLLERENAPKSENANANMVMNWYKQSIDDTRVAVFSNDNYLSNWFRLQLPRHLYSHQFRGPTANLSSLIQKLKIPCRIVGQNLLTFAPPDKINEAIGEDRMRIQSLKLETQNFIADGGKIIDIAQSDASNILTDLIRQAWEFEMQRQNLCEFELANRLRAWFFKHGHLEKNRVHFTTKGGRRTYRQFVGLKSKRNTDGVKVRDGYWHYAMSASPQLHPFPRIVLRYHVLFTDDGCTPWENTNRMHKARRSVCKNWWNKEWRDRLLAFCTQIGAGEEKLELVTGGQNIEMTMTPICFISPYTYFEDGETGIDETIDIELIEDANEEVEDIDEEAEDDVTD